MSLKIFVILFLLIIVTTNQIDPPRVVVYTESYCPDCVQFEINSFNEFINNPSRNLLAKEIVIVPFGNARELPDSKEGARKFSCQHGEKECYGNKVENCVRDIFGAVYDEKFLVCISQNLLESGYSSDFDVLTAKCVTSKVDVDKIVDCARGEKGGELLHIAAQNTGDHKYVPYILVNGVHDEKIQTLAEQNLVNFLCTYNNLVGKVEGCMKTTLQDMIEMNGKCMNNFAMENNSEFKGFLDA